MCLAVAGKVVELDGCHAVVDVQGNRVNAVTILVPEVKVSDYVLLHAGFAIAITSRQEHDEQHRIFKEIEKHARQILQD
ncbi:MAG: hypothetical protein AMJ79_14170 [Phycisphaerae bacterium SM23_30]|nr:MAG: hypothetical protein AMJ79_14170 [Phycisphaerae bacterium SM23_30]